MDPNQPFNEHEYVAMQMTTISGLFTRKGGSPEEVGKGLGTSVPAGVGEATGLPIWRAGAEAVEAQRGVVTAVLEMLPSFLAEADLTLRATAGHSPCPLTLTHVWINERGN